MMMKEDQLTDQVLSGGGVKEEVNPICYSIGPLRLSLVAREKMCLVNVDSDGSKDFNNEP